MKARLLLFLPFVAAAISAAACGGSDHRELSGAPVRSVDAGAGTGTGGAVNAAPAACLPVLAGCDGGTLPCCDGSLCLAQNGAKRCVQTCSSRFDCGSLCCLDDATAKRKVCASADACPPLPCSDVGGPCDEPGPTCCQGLACVSSTSSDYAGCRKSCASATDCDTGCCVPYADGTFGFCGTKDQCLCASEYGACGGTRHCCDGLVCTSVDTPGAFACRRSCKSKADCATACCLGITGTGDSACMPATWCQTPSK